MPRYLIVCAVVDAWLLLASWPAAADESEAPPVTAAAAEKGSDAERLDKQAHDHFDSGVKLTASASWDAALTEFLESRKLHATANATINAAVCLVNLQRDPEALEMFEAFLRDFPNVAADRKHSAQSEVERLHAIIGVIDFGEAEIGATIDVDGRPRGTHPLAGPLYVAPGSHRVRVSKKGFETLEATVRVSPGHTVQVVARLHVLAPPVDPRPQPQPPSPGLRPSPPGSPRWAWATAGVGVAALGVAAGFGIDGLSAKSQGDDICHGTSPCAGLGTAQAASLNSRKDVGLGVFLGAGIAGAAGVTAGLIGLLRGEKASRNAGDPATPLVVGPGFGGVTFAGRF